MRRLCSDDKINNMVRFLVEQAPPGIVVEVGVYQGGSLARLAETGRCCIGFDTFEGLPEGMFNRELDTHHPGDFNDTSLEAVLLALTPFRSVALIKGIFPHCCKDLPQPCALAHLDCDLYESVIQSLHFLHHRMVPGGRIYLDDAFCPSTKGATMAMCEFAHYSGLVPIWENGAYFQF